VVRMSKEALGQRAELLQCKVHMGEKYTPHTGTGMLMSAQCTVMQP